MSYKSTNTLIALFFAALLGLWFVNARLASRPTVPARGGPLLGALVGLRPDDLRRIEIDRGADRLVFERRGDRAWQMLAPVDAAADPALLENLAVRLKGLTRLPQADSLRGNPADFGLTPSGASDPGSADNAPSPTTVRLWGVATDAPLAQLDLGRTLLDRRYVRVGLDSRGTIEVVPAQGLEVVDLPLRRWRDREPLRASPIEVDGVTVAVPGRPSLRLTRGFSAWRITEPSRLVAEPKRVEELIGGLAALRISDDRQFVADDVQGDADRDRYGLLHPRLTVTLTAGRGSLRRPDQTLLVGNPVPDQVDRVYAQRADQNEVLALDARVLDRLRDLQPNALRGSRVADINPNRAVRLRISRLDESFDLVRLGQTWTFDSPRTGPVDPKVVQDYFKALEALQTTLYLPDDDASQRLANTRQPRLTVQVWQAPDPRRPTSTSTSAAEAVDPADPTRPADFALRFGTRSATQNVQYAQIEGDRSILVLNQGAGSPFDQGSWAFRDRLVLQVASATINRIRVEGVRPAVTLQAPALRIKVGENAPNGWWVADPVAAPADRDAVARLLKLLGALRVDGFAAERPATLKPFGLDQPVLRLTWSTPSPGPPVPLLAPPKADPSTGLIRSEERTLLVGAPVAERPSDRYAMIAGESLVFILGPAAVATLDAEYRDHTISQFDPRAVARIHLEYPGTPYAFDLVRGDRGWAPPSPAPATALPAGFPLESVDAAVRAASALTTIRFAQYQGEAPATLALAPPFLRVRFEGEGLRSPVALDFGRPLDAQLVFAMAPTALPGAVFLINHAPFLPWLNTPVRPELELPANVFEADDPPAPPPPPAAQPPGTGQPAAQPR